MSPAAEQRSVRRDLPTPAVSLVRAAAPWKRAAAANTTLPEAQIEVPDWQPDRQRLAAYRALLESAAELPIAFAQVPIMALHLDLLSQWSFPIKAMGMVHLGTTIEVLDELNTQDSWCLRAWVAGSRHVKSGLEFDLQAEVSTAGKVCWRSTAVTLSRSKSAAGAEPSTVPRPAASGEWESEVALPVPEGTGRAFGRLTGDVNPIHLHAIPARALGFRRAVAHGWWITGRTVAVLGVDEAIPGRRLEIAFRRPVELPSTPVLRAGPGSDSELNFALFGQQTPDDDARPARELVAGSVSG